MTAVIELQHHVYVLTYIRMNACAYIHVYCTYIHTVSVSNTYVQYVCPLHILCVCCAVCILSIAFIYTYVAVLFVHSDQVLLVCRCVFSKLLPSSSQTCHPRLPSRLWVCRVWQCLEADYCSAEHWLLPCQHICEQEGITGVRILG